MDLLPSALLIFGVLFALVVIIGTYSAWLVKVPPNVAAVITGRRGFRIVKGGSTMVIPILERLDLLSLEVITIPLKIPGAYTKEGVSVTVDAVAVVKIKSDDVSLRNAAERFLGMSRDQIHAIVNETLTGHLRSILGILTVEEINADRQAFAGKVAEESTVDLERMGMGIDVLTIQHISDDLGYLDSLGRRRTAEVLRDAQIGEADAQRDAMIRSSQALQEGQSAKAASEANIALAQRDRDIKMAGYQAEVNSAKATAEQAGPLADAQARQQVVVEEVRVEQVRTQGQISVQEQEVLRKQRELEATIIKPADAERQAAILRAEGERQAKVTLAEAEAKELEFEGAGQGERARKIGTAEAEVTKLKADARRSELVAEADGERAKLLAQAEGHRASLLAGAEGQRAALLAEAEGKQRLAEALNAYQSAAVHLTLSQAFIQTLPQMVEGAARPLGQIGNLTVIDTGGGGNGGGPLARLSAVVPANLLAFMESFQAVTGIDLKAGLERAVNPPPAPVDGTAHNGAPPPLNPEPEVVEKE